MEQATIIQLLSFCVGLGLVWGSLNDRINQLEREIDNNRDLSERLTRIEEKVFYIAENIKTNK